MNVDTSPESIEALCHGNRERYVVEGPRCMAKMEAMLRAIAAEKRAAVDGITADIRGDAIDEFRRACPTVTFNDADKGVRAALQSAALALQGKDAQPIAYVITPHDPSGEPFLSFSAAGFPKDHFLIEALRP